MDGVETPCPDGYLPANYAVVVSGSVSPELPTPLAMPAALRPSADELAVNRLYGPDAGTPQLPAPRAGVSTRQALEDAVTRALQQPPCFVLLDGSAAAAALLVLSAQVARREGLDAPIAITWHEDSRVVAAEGRVAAEIALRHAGLDDLERLPVSLDGTELLGERKRPLLQRHGVQLPAGWTALSHPALHAAGGTLLTGFGLAAIAAMPRRPTIAAVAASRSPRLRDLTSAAADIAPPFVVRAAVQRSTFMRHVPWLTPNARGRLAALEGRRAAAVPVRFDEGLRRLWSDRRYRSVLFSTQLVGEAARTSIVSPFAEPAVLAALIGERGGVHAREGSLLFEVLGDVLPADVITSAERVALATRTRLRRAAGGPRVVAPEPWGASTQVGRRSIAWIQRWDGSGVDTTRVDAGALRRELLVPNPSPRAFAAIQRAWLEVGAPDLPA